MNDGCATMTGDRSCEDVLVTMDIGVLFERNGPSIITIDEARIYNDILGPHGVGRLTVPGHVVMPATGEWFPKERAFYPDFGPALTVEVNGEKIDVRNPLHDDLHSTDRCILNLRAGGFDYILASVIHASADATEEGKTSFMPYTDNGPWSWVLDADGDATTGIARYDPSKGCVKDPAHLKPLWSQEYGWRIVDRWHEGGYIQAVTGWNEFDEVTYNPSWRDTPSETEPKKAAADDFIQRFWIPFFIGARIADPKVELWGPETAYLDGLVRYLKAEQEFGFRADVLSWHNYDDHEVKTLAGAKDGLDQRLDVLAQFGDTRRRCITECSDDSGKSGEWIVDFMEYAASKGIATFVCGEKQRWIAEEKDGVGRVVRRTINALGREVQKFCASQRRRAVTP